MDSEESDKRGQKRSLTEAGDNGLKPAKKLIKTSSGSGQPSVSTNKKNHNNGAKKLYQKNLTPEQKAYEREIKEKSKKYQRTPVGRSKVWVPGTKHRELKELDRKQKEMFSAAADKAARAEILLTAQTGFMEPDNELETTWRVKQKDIAEQSDLATKNKIFNLKLEQYGPYSMKYSRNGRYILLGGEKGHVALVDWHKNRLLCELYLDENVRDVSFLHNETMFAVAQKKYVYIYDKKGVEIHKLSHHLNPFKLNFLPYHFLLVSVGREGVLRYQDTSTGEIIAEMKSRLGPCVVLAQNPRTAVIHLGHVNGSVTLWTPTVFEPVVKMLCHRAPITCIAIDSMGSFMVTSAEDGLMKVWDLKTYQLLQSYYLKRPIQTMAISQTGLLAISFGCHIQVWKDYVRNEAPSAYMTYKIPEGGQIRAIDFCPFDDVLGIGHDHGFSSIVIPGAGEANIDTFVANPYENKKQRREATVQRLLDKLQPSMITLDPEALGGLTTDSYSQHAKDVKESMQKKADPSAPPKRQRSKKKKLYEGSNIVSKKREEVQEENNKRLLKEQKERKLKAKQQELEDENENAAPKPALSRFSK